MEEFKSFHPKINFHKSLIYVKQKWQPLSKKVNHNEENLTKNRAVFLLWHFPFTFV